MKAYLEAKRIETRVLFVGNILRHPGSKDIFFEKE